MALKNSKISQYAFELLKQFIDKNQDALDLLKNSLENVPPKEQVRIMTLFNQQYQVKKFKLADEKVRQKESNIMQKLFDTVRMNSHMEYYEKQFETWNKNIAKESNLPEYLDKLFKTEDKRTLVELDTSRAIQGLQLSLQNYCKAKDCPIFYIHSPEDFVCSAR